jgi:hypothetical protein
MHRIQMFRNEINREGTNYSKINERIKLGRYATSTLNSVLWNKNVTKRKKNVFMIQ